MRHVDRAPRFSVVLPVRDRAESVGRVVASVLAQTFADLELLVVDLGSADRTLDAVLAVADDRVRLIGMTDGTTGSAPDAANRMTGAAAAHAAALAGARGRWSVLLDADSEVDPGWLARLGRLADATGAEFVSCGGRQLDGRGTCTEVRPVAEGGGAPACLRAGAFATTTDRLRAAVELIGPDLPLRSHPAGSRRREVDPGQPCSHFGRAALDLVLLDDRVVVHSPELLLSWHEPAGDDGDGASIEGDELQLRLAYQGLDALARTPIPDSALLARYATSGGVAAARLRQGRDARRLLRIACQARPDVRRHWTMLLAAHLGPLGQRAWTVGEPAA